MMFHRQPLLLADIEMLSGSEQESGTSKANDVEEVSPSTFIEKMSQIRDDLKEKACSNICKAQKSQKDYYDRRHLQEVSSSAQYVL